MSPTYAPLLLLSILEMVSERLHLHQLPISVISQALHHCWYSPTTSFHQKAVLRITIWLLETFPSSLMTITLLYIQLLESRST